MQKEEGAVAKDFDPFRPDNIINMPSPSLGYVFAGAHGLPRGYSCILWGKPGGGKSLIASAIAGQLHKDDSEAIVIKWNTELRESGQITPSQKRLLGIDDDRYIAFDRNQPEGVFDYICSDVAAMCQAGAPIKLIIIDSITNIMGRLEQDSTSVLDFRIGDEAFNFKNWFQKDLAYHSQVWYWIGLYCSGTS